MALTIITILGGLLVNAINWGTIVPLQRRTEGLIQNLTGPGVTRLPLHSGLPVLRGQRMRGIGAVQFLLFPADPVLLILIPVTVGMHHSEPQQGTGSF